MKYNELKNEILFLRNRIPLNLIELDCSKVNTSMAGLIEELRQYIVDYFFKLNKDQNTE